MTLCNRHDADSILHPPPAERSCVSIVQRLHCMPRSSSPGPWRFSPPCRTGPSRRARQCPDQVSSAEMSGSRRCATWLTQRDILSPDKGSLIGNRVYKEPVFIPTHVTSRRQKGIRHEKDFGTAPFFCLRGRTWRGVGGIEFPTSHSRHRRVPSGSRRRCRNAHSRPSGPAQTPSATASCTRCPT
jgi:hypothetical protein